MMIKFLKMCNKDKIVKSDRGKKTFYTKKNTFSLKAMQARRKYSNILKVWKEKTVNMGFYTQQKYV